MNFGAQEQQDETGIELTPLIDVVFLLLIFFMISTTFTKETKLEINLPDANGEATQQGPFIVEVQVGRNQEYAIASPSNSVGASLVNGDRATLVRALSEFKNQSQILIVIRADRLAPHEAVVRVLDVAQELGMTNISFAAQQSATE